MKNRFTVIIVLMVISLFGIILVQSLWIRQSIKAEEARFDKAVFSALNSSVAQLERGEIFQFIDEKIDLPLPKGRYHPFGKRQLRGMNLRNRQPDSLFRLDQEENSIVILSDTTGETKQIVKIVHPESNWYSEDEIEMDVNVEVIKTQNMAKLAMSMDTLTKQMELNRKRGEEMQNQIIRQKLEEFNQSMEQWVYEFSFNEKNPLDNFMLDNVDSLVSRAFENNGIKLKYNTQIIKLEKDTVVILRSTVASGTMLKEKYKTELFPNDFVRKNLFLVVDFPDKSKHIFQAIAFSLIGSVIFTLIILFTFGMTVYYIRKQKKLSEIKNDFINNMTHEFKTPIATISLAADALSSPKVFGKKENTDYYLGIIRQENKRMNTQVEKVLQMALIENHELNLDFQQIDIHQLVENVVHVAELAVQEKKGRITYSLKASDFMILADETQMGNVLVNLLDNALKYNDKIPEILIETFNRENKLIIQVSDNGIGMSKEVQKHIFEKFYRKPTGNIHNVKGFGLGLSYVKAIVSALKGEIFVKSEPGNGTIFTLMFDVTKDSNL